MKKYLVLLGIQNDLIAGISQLDYAQVCNKIKTLLEEHVFDKVYFYSINNTLVTPSLYKENYIMCEENSLGANLHWNILETEAFLSKDESVRVTEKTDGLYYPKLKNLDEAKIYFAGNLYYIKQAVQDWNIQNYAVIPSAVWLSRLSWPAMLSAEFKDLDFFNTDIDYSSYKTKYLKQYYPGLKSCKL